MKHSSNEETLSVERTSNNNAKDMNNATTKQSFSNDSHNLRVTTNPRGGVLGATSPRDRVTGAVAWARERRSRGRRSNSLKSPASRSSISSPLSNGSAASILTDERSPVHSAIPKTRTIDFDANRINATISRSFSSHTDILSPGNSPTKKFSNTISPRTSSVAGEGSGKVFSASSIPKTRTIDFDPNRINANISKSFSSNTDMISPDNSPKKKINNSISPRTNSVVREEGSGKVFFASSFSTIADENTKPAIEVEQTRKQGNTLEDRAIEVISSTRVPNISSPKTNASREVSVSSGSTEDSNPMSPEMLEGIGRYIDAVTKQDSYLDSHSSSSETDISLPRETEEEIGAFIDSIQRKNVNERIPKKSSDETLSMRKDATDQCLSKSDVEVVFKGYVPKSEMPCDEKGAQLSRKKASLSVIVSGDPTTYDFSMPLSPEQRAYMEYQKSFPPPPPTSPPPSPPKQKRGSPAKKNGSQTVAKKETPFNDAENDNRMDHSPVKSPRETDFHKEDRLKNENVFLSDSDSFSPVSTSLKSKSPHDARKTENINLPVTLKEKLEEKIDVYSEQRFESKNYMKTDKVQNFPEKSMDVKTKRETEEEGVERDNIFSKSSEFEEALGETVESLVDDFMQDMYVDGPSDEWQSEPAPAISVEKSTNRENEEIIEAAKSPRNYSTRITDSDEDIDKAIELALGEGLRNNNKEEISVDQKIIDDGNKICKETMSSITGTNEKSAIQILKSLDEEEENVKYCSQKKEIKETDDFHLEVTPSEGDDFHIEITPSEGTSDEELEKLNRMVQKICKERKADALSFIGNNSENSNFDIRSRLDSESRDEELVDAFISGSSSVGSSNNSRRNITEDKATLVSTFSSDTANLEESLNMEKISEMEELDEGENISAHISKINAFKDGGHLEKNSACEQVSSEENVEVDVYHGLMKNEPESKASGLDEESWKRDSEDEDSWKRASEDEDSWKRASEDDSWKRASDEEESWMNEDNISCNDTQEKIVEQSQKDAKIALRAIQSNNKQFEIGVCLGELRLEESIEESSSYEDERKSRQTLLSKKNVKSKPNYERLSRSMKEPRKNETDGSHITKKNRKITPNNKDEERTGWNEDAADLGSEDNSKTVTPNRKNVGVRSSTKQGKSERYSRLPVGRSASTTRTGRQNELTSPVVQSTNSGSFDTSLDNNGSIDLAKVPSTLSRVPSSLSRVPSLFNDLEAMFEQGEKKTKLHLSKWNLDKGLSQSKSAEFEIPTHAFHAPQIGGVSAALTLQKWSTQQGKKKNTVTLGRPWKLPYGKRIKNHPGYFNVDVFSLYESSAVVGVCSHKFDDEPWENRDVKQRFLHEKSISMSRNWFGNLRRKRGNDRYKEPVAQPKSMEMPIENLPNEGDWIEEWYTTWQQKKIDKQRSATEKSSTESCSSSDSSSCGSETYTYDGETTYRDDQSYDSDDYSESAFTKSFAESVFTSRPSATQSKRSSHGDDDSWDEDPPECGTLHNVKLKIGERVSLVTHEHLSSLRRSRWRKKYFPRGTFPYRG